MDNSKSKKQVKENTKKNLNKKKANKKQSLIITIVILIVIVFVILLCIIFSNKNKNIKIENGIEINKSELINQERTLEDLKVTNIQVKKENDISYIYADVINESDKEQGAFDIYISVLDNSGNEIIGFCDVLPLIKPGEKTNINVSATNDFVNAYDLKITKLEEEKKE